MVDGQLPSRLLRASSFSHALQMLYADQFNAFVKFFRPLA